MALGSTYAGIGWIPRGYDRYGNVDDQGEIVEDFNSVNSHTAVGFGKLENQGDLLAFDGTDCDAIPGGVTDEYFPIRDSSINSGWRVNNNPTAIRTDSITEKTLNNGVNIEASNFKDNTGYIDVIEEKTLDNGVRVEQVLLKDNKMGIFSGPSQPTTPFSEIHMRDTAQITPMFLLESNVSGPGVNRENLLTMVTNAQESISEVGLCNDNNACFITGKFNAYGQHIFKKTKITAKNDGATPTTEAPTTIVTFDSASAGVDRILCQSLDTARIVVASDTDNTGANNAAVQLNSKGANVSTTISTGSDGLLNLICSVRPGYGISGSNFTDFVVSSGVLGAPPAGGVLPTFISSTELIRVKGSDKSVNTRGDLNMYDTTGATLQIKFPTALTTDNTKTKILTMDSATKQMYLADKATIIPSPSTLSQINYQFQAVCSNGILTGSPLVDIKASIIWDSAASLGQTSMFVSQLSTSATTPGNAFRLNVNWASFPYLRPYKTSTTYVDFFVHTYGSNVAKKDSTGTLWYEPSIYPSYYIVWYKINQIDSWVVVGGETIIMFSFNASFVTNGL